MTIIMSDNFLTMLEKKVEYFISFVSFDISMKRFFYRAIAFLRCDHSLAYIISRKIW